MGDYKVIGDVDDTLRELLWSRMQDDSDILSIIGTEQQISFEPPFKIVQDAEPAQDSLSVFLYRISENGDMKNRPLQRAGAGLLRYPPLPLNLFYLLTPLTKSAENDHMLLSKAMHILYDNAIVKGSELQGGLADAAEELRIILNPMTLEDSGKLWSAFMRPFRLSVCYEVKVVYIDSEREQGAGRVLRKRLEVTQVGS
jgi:hypothetical protein